MTSGTVNHYGLEFPAEEDPLNVELWFVAQGGIVQNGYQKCGKGLAYHIRAAMHMLWPELVWHRWLDLLVKEYAATKVLGIMGPASCNKTDFIASMALIELWAAPDSTCCIVSSTESRGLELRVWGRIKTKFNAAVERYPFLQGNVLESHHAIAIDDIDDEYLDRKKGRVLNKGIICVPCLQGGTFVGMGRYSGVKSPRLRLYCDEVSFMGSSFLDGTSNLRSNPDFKGVFIGNPIDILDPLGQACEPRDGWEAHPDNGKTQVWDTKFLRGRCVNLDGRDSPNNDFPGPPKKYPFLPSQQDLDEVASFWGMDSQQYYSMAVGVMKAGLVSKRVITRQLCIEHHAMDKAIWEGVKRTRIYAIDAAYSGVGGDRCVGGWVEFGPDTRGKTILRVNPPSIVPVSLKIKDSPEDQIARYVKGDTEANLIEPENIFYDSTGRGTLGAAFARIFGSRTPVPVEFGGKPSKRPVRHDLFVEDGSGRRHRRCDEHYLDFVTELWFSVRYVIECDQMRELPEDVMQEGCAREYGRTNNNRIFVESKHDKKARERMRRSPDLFDWLCTAIEGARQRGFQIERLGAVHVEKEEKTWYEIEAENYRRLIQNSVLAH